MSADVHAQLAAVMEALVLAAVAEFHKQRRGGSDQIGDLRPGGESTCEANVRGESREKLVCFATILETLANEALGKIVNIVDMVKSRRCGKPTRGGGDGDETPRVAIINVLKKPCLEAEHSYDVPSLGSGTNAPAQDESPDRKPSILAASDLDAIAERGGPDAEPSASWHLCESGAVAWEPEAPGGAADKPFACELCGRRFTLRHNLRRHTDSHMGSKSFCCGQCGKGFTRAATLKTHELVHTGQKPLKCQFCPKSFRHLVNLKNHVRLHSGVRPYACDFCAKTFRQKVNLKIHRRVHTGERPYACRQCGKAFSQQSSLITHGRTHSGERPYVCDVCRKSFNNNNSLKLHVRVHTGERPYTCDVCLKTFIQGSHLRTHKSHVHAGRKLFICDKCGKAYANGRNLKTHKCVYA
ncbi:uncharacterized protein LOC144038714 isoform X2 [Vanacampus margaritifer]